MLSKITIEVDFSNKNLPVIQILQRDSDDVRDKLISNFLQGLMHTSRWCKIEYNGQYMDTHRWNIAPITPYELSDEIKLMEVTIADMGYEPKSNQS